MSVRVAKVVVVDGVDVNISAEGGSAAEALAIVEREAEDIGAAPDAGATNGAAKGSRKRRTRAEMDAARAGAAQQAPNEPPYSIDMGDKQKAPDRPVQQQTLPGLPGPAIPAGEPQRVFQDHGGSQFQPPKTEGPPFTPPGTASVLPGNAAFAEGPSIPQGGKSVTFEGPPPPAFDGPPSPPPPPQRSEDEDLREKINAKMLETIALQPAWRDHVIQAMHHHADPHGGDIFKMHTDQLRQVLAGVEDYDRKVRDHLAGRK